MPNIDQLALRTEDYERYNLATLLCNRCTLGCNVIRVVSRDDGKLILCGKKQGTQEMLNAKRETLGIPAPGEKWR